MLLSSARSADLASSSVAQMTPAMLRCGHWTDQTSARNAVNDYGSTSNLTNAAATLCAVDVLLPADKELSAALAFELVYGPDDLCPTGRAEDRIGADSALPAGLAENNFEGSALRHGCAFPPCDTLRLGTNHSAATGFQYKRRCAAPAGTGPLAPNSARSFCLLSRELFPRLWYDPG